MSIIINNSDTNVNIQCNVGFYMVVVKPCLAAFSEGSVNQYSTIQVTCTDSYISCDKSGVPDLT